MSDAFITRRGGAGGGLNFKVVGGTTQPSNPMENTIWVNTPDEITGWGFGTEADKPATPDTGMVWFVTSEDSFIKFDALKDDDIIVTPTAAYQYVSGSWESVSSVKIYQNGEWIDWWNGELYTPGNEWTGVTGGWITKNTRRFNESDAYVKTAPTLTKNEQYMSVALPTNKGVKTGAIETANSIDVTKFDTLIIEFSNINKGTDNNYYVELVPLDAPTYYNEAKNGIPAVWRYSGSNTCTLDISSASGSYVVAIVYQHWSNTSTGGSFNVINARLE